MQTLPSPAVADLTDFVDLVRLDAARRLQPERRSALGQFFTPAAIARLMTSLSTPKTGTVRLLDPGAGVGVLAAAWVARACGGKCPPNRIEIVAYEVDDELVPALTSVLEGCQEHGQKHGVAVTFEIRQEDFISSAVELLTGGFFGTSAPQFDVVILNPPYGKIRTDSPERRLLREVGVETSNLYTAFVSLALRSLTEGGELIAITPRSFCNGPYFTPFRRDLLRLASLTHVHVFDSRDVAFGEDEVLQENVVFRVERGHEQANCVQVEWSDSGDAQHTTRREVPFSQVVRSGDPDAFIHIAPDEWDARIAHIVRGLRGSIETLGVQVSTGRVVDFRVKDFLRAEPDTGTVPLIYPTHFSNGRIEWPRVGSKKPNAIERAPETQAQLNPTGTYVLVKRFSSKEEQRRVVAAVFTPEAAPGEFVAFENHLNYFHRRGHSLPRKLADGLAAYLNSTLLDSYFRQFNGHTQVNATDLRKLPYPTDEQLERISERVGGVSDQSDLDDIVEGELIDLPDKPRKNTAAQRRVVEACSILKALGLPKEQTNERAGFTLLALLDLTPKQPWSAASAPLRGVTPIMEFAAEHYGKQWKPNTRETVRRSTLHQFQDAGLVVPNPDKEDRPVNSPAYCYQVPETALELLRSWGSPEWEKRLGDYLVSAPALAEKYASERQMKRIPLRIREGLEITLSPGGQNELIREIVDEFCPRFTPGANAIYVGDADEKWGYFDEAALSALGVTVDEHGKMPDVVVHFTEKNWLILIEAVTSHGPVNAKRHGELKELFKSSSAPLVFVTAFRNRPALNKYMTEIAWETEVWVADAPTHMIHFNGERFLGPYE
ncbi:MAG: putative O-methyltransferase [Gemmatimonadetes bacterium]|nr:putative O-methyltransferase [Gemmatimonadota bacterium]